jgi:hypothetical protein
MLSALDLISWFELYLKVQLTERVAVGGGSNRESSDGEGSNGPEMVIVDGQHRLGACAHLAAIAASEGGEGGGGLQQHLGTVTVEVLIPVILSAFMMFGAENQPSDARQQCATFEQLLGPRIVKECSIQQLF